MDSYLRITATTDFDCVRVPLLTCIECGALLSEDSRARHDSWHVRVCPVDPEISEGQRMSERINLYNRLRRRLGRSYTTFDPDHVMPDKFHELARYNTEKSHGLAHRPEHAARMAELQREFNAYLAE